MNKKGSMELSVNSIVILVIAIVMLGLILGFVRSKFGDISKNIELEEAAPPKATGSDPLTVSRSMVVLSQGQTAVLRLSYFEASEPITALTPTVLCDPLSDADGGPIPSAGHGKDSVTNSAVEYSIRITGGTVKDTYICTVSMDDPATATPRASKDITVKVV